MAILKYIALSLPLLGTQIAWSFEFCYGTLILFDRGFSAYLTTLVWLAGPLTGLIVQPLMGSFSDNYQTRYGKRRPFIFLGWFLTVSSLMLLMWESPFPILTSFIAFYILDASLNICMAGTRALMVDNTDNEDQISLNAWATRLVGAGSFIGYLFAILDFDARGQVQSVLALTIFIFSCTVMLTLFTTRERNSGYVVIETSEDLERYYQTANISDETLRERLVNATKSIWDLARSIPNEPELAYIYRVQFFSWVGWFPILFYNSAWLAKLFLDDCPTCDFDETLRAGSLGMLFFSILSFLGSIFMPMLFQCSFIDRYVSNKDMALKMLWAISQALFAILTGTIMLLSVIDKMTFSLGAIFVSGLGLCWSITLWIPFVLLSEYTIRNRPEEAGALLGLTNIFTVLPQFVSIAFCSMILWVTTDISWIFAVACISSTVSSICAYRYR